MRRDVRVGGGEEMIGDDEGDPVLDVPAPNVDEPLIVGRYLRDRGGPVVADHHQRIRQEATGLSKIGGRLAQHHERDGLGHHE